MVDASKRLIPEPPAPQYAVRDAAFEAWANRQGLAPAYKEAIAAIFNAGWAARKLVDLRAVYGLNPITGKPNDRP